MTAEPVEPVEPAKPIESVVPTKHGWPGLAVAALFGLFYAYTIWTAVNGVFFYVQVHENLETSVPWAIYVAEVLLPVLIFVLAFLLGRRRTLLEQAVLYFAGLAVVAALTLGLHALDVSILTGVVSGL